MKKKLLEVLLFLLKMFVAFCALLFLADAFVTTADSDTNDWTFLVYYISALITATLFVFWIFMEFNRTFYALLERAFTQYSRIFYALIIGFFLLYVGMRNFNSEIKEKHDWSDCASSGRVWDHAEKRCRDDCLTWNKEQGCVFLNQ